MHIWEVPSLRFYYEEDGHHFISPSWSAAPGSLIYLSGENGSGKTTYLKVLLEFWQSNDVSYFGHEPTATYTKSLLEFFSSQASRMIPLSQYQSQGQQRVAFFRSLFCFKKKIWLLDEPWINLDLQNVLEITKDIEQFLGSGGLVIYTSHQEVPRWSQTWPQQIMRIEKDVYSK